MHEPSHGRLVRSVGANSRTCSSTRAARSSSITGDVDGPVVAVATIRHTTELAVASPNVTAAPFESAIEATIITRYAGQARDQHNRSYHARPTAPPATWVAGRS